MPKPRRAFALWLVNRFVPTAYKPLNPLVVRLLASPLHPLLSWYVAVVRFEGTRTRRIYQVPFTYHRVDATTVECATNRRALWWRNLRGGVPASLLFKGRWLPAGAEAVESLGASEQALNSRDRVRSFVMDVPPEEAVVVRVTVDD